jgi:hypothetical protein
MQRPRTSSAIGRLTQHFELEEHFEFRLEIDVVCFI